MRKDHNNDNVSNDSEYNDIDNVMGVSDIRLTEHSIELYTEFLTAGFRTYSNLGFLNLACTKLQEFMYKWQNELNETERKYLAQSIPYTEYIASPYWHFVALIYRCRANFHCQRCGEARRTRLSVHHKTYEHIGSELQYPEDMEVLCATCHMKEHGIERSKNA